MRTPSRATQARREARRERIREARLSKDPLHVFTPRTTLILGAICTVLAGALVFVTETGLWAGVGAFVFLMLLAGGGVVLNLALRGPDQLQADRRWADELDGIERAEKHAALGHTAGGLSTTEDAAKGGLSDPE